jgi:cytochrome c oxidase cbb3-type subunit 4
MMGGYWGHAVGVITLILLIAFLGLWIWAWLPRHKRVFDRMARLPLENDAAPPPGSGENGNDSDTRTEGGEDR